MNRNTLVIIVVAVIVIIDLIWIFNRGDHGDVGLTDYVCTKQVTGENGKTYCADGQYMRIVADPSSAEQSGGADARH